MVEQLPEMVLFVIGNASIGVCVIKFKEILANCIKTIFMQ